MKAIIIYLGSSAAILLLALHYKGVPVIQGRILIGGLIAINLGFLIHLTRSRS